MGPISAEFQFFNFFYTSLDKKQLLSPYYRSLAECIFNIGVKMMVNPKGWQKNFKELNLKNKIDIF